MLVYRRLVVIEAFCGSLDTEGVVVEIFWRR